MNQTILDTNTLQSVPSNSLNFGGFKNKKHKCLGIRVLSINSRITVNVKRVIFHNIATSGILYQILNFNIL